MVQAVAQAFEIERLYLPTSSPNLNLIERFWRFVKKQCLYSKYYPDSPSFQQAIFTCIQQASTTHKEELKRLLTLRCQTFAEVAIIGDESPLATGAMKKVLSKAAQSIEHFLRLVIKCMDEINAADSIAQFVPPYLKRVAAAVRRRIDKTTLMDEGYQDYIRLTEDAIWSLISAAADSEAVPMLQRLAPKLLARKLLQHFAVNAGKTDLLRETLVQGGLVEDEDFHVVDLKTTMYKSDSHEPVFVIDGQGAIEEVGEHSDIISALRDRPEAEALLIVIDPGKDPVMRELGKKSQSIVLREDHPPG